MTDEAEWVQLDSSNLAAARWYPADSASPDVGFLEIIFDPKDPKTGSPRGFARKYRYLGVPKEVYEGLLASESKGKYHAAHIKWAYPFEELD